MSDQPDALEHVTEGGLSAAHIELPSPQGFVAPSNSGSAHNTIKASLVPFACWRAHDMRFDFGSSFVRPEIATDIGALKRLIDRHTLPNEKGEPQHKPALSIFGHADPTGNDDFNKKLSGRRAQAIYGMLVRKTELWEDLYANPLGEDKWEPQAIHSMQAALGQPLSDHPSSSARKALFRAYMDHVCTVVDPSGQPALNAQGQPVQLELKPTDFLADSADKNGKGDYQGCGEFNALRRFSKAEEQEFSDPKNKEARDRENSPNRRVMILLFRPGVRVAVDAWPCPRAREGVAGCKKRFWSDADKRRQAQEDRREFQQSHDTFACRFYQRFTDHSPCERILITFSFRLYDLQRHFIPLAPFELSVGGRAPVKSVADPNGLAIVPDVEAPNEVRIRWGFPPEAGQPPQLVFEGQMFLDPDDDDREIEAKQKLQNLGYPLDDPLDENVAAFQRDYGLLASPPLRETRKLDDPTLALLRDVFASSEDDLLKDKPQHQENA